SRRGGDRWPGQVLYAATHGPLAHLVAGGPALRGDDLRDGRPRPQRRVAAVRGDGAPPDFIIGRSLAPRGDRLVPRREVLASALALGLVVARAFPSRVEQLACAAHRIFRGGDIAGRAGAQRGA